MKLSTYNSIIYISGRHSLIYNALSGKFIVSKDKLINPELILTDSDANSISMYKDAGILIDDNVDEIGDLKNLIFTTDNNNKTIHIHINPTLDCNFRCWYCYENHIPKSKMMPEVVSAVKKHIKSQLISNPETENLHLSFFGGEPLMYFKDTAEPIIKYSSDICKEMGFKFDVNFTSNADLLTEDIISFLSSYPCGFQITLDGDREAHNKTRFRKGGEGSFDNIIKNIKQLIANKIGVILRINYTSQNIESIVSIPELLKDIDKDNRKLLRIDLQRVWQDKSKTKDYAEIKANEIRCKFEEEGYMVLCNYLLHSVKDSCYADKANYLLINYNGDIFGCTARDFNKKNRIGFLKSDGTVSYISDIYEQRSKIKFSKPICHTCRIAPLCGGGCRQRALESPDNNVCTYGYSEIDKDNKILDIFEYCFCNNNN